MAFTNIKNLNSIKYLRLILKPITDNNGKSINSRIFCSRQSSLSVNSVDKNKPDVLLEKLNEASTAGQIQTLIENNITTATALHFARAIRHTAQISRNETELVKKLDLTTLCNALTRKARFLTITQVVHVIQDLSKLEISSRTIVMQTLLQHLADKVNSLSFNQILFLEGVLKRLDATPLVSSLMTAFPMVVKNHLDMQINHEDLHELCHLFRFATYHKFSLRQMKLIAGCILECKSEWTQADSSFILWGLSSLHPDTAPQFELLMKKAASKFALNSADMSQSDFVTLMSRLHKKNYLNRYLFTLASGKAVEQQWDLENIHFLAKIAKEQRFTDFSFFGIYSKLVEKNIKEHTLPVSIFEVIDVFASINFVPRSLELMWTWAKLQLQTEELKPNLLVQFMLNLVTLGMEPNVIRDPIFTKYNVTTLLTTKQESAVYSIKKSLILLHLFGAQNLLAIDTKNLWLEKLAGEHSNDDNRIEFSLKRAVHAAFINKFHVWDSFLTDSGIYIDHLLLEKDDSVLLETYKQGYLADGRVRYCNEEFPPALKRIAILLRTSKDYAVDSPRITGDPVLDSRLLRHDGFQVIEINDENWTKLLEKEQVSYLIRAVNENLK